MRRKIEMSNMLIEKERKKERKRKKMRKLRKNPFATTRDNVAYDVRVIVLNFLSVCYNER
jgi:hypothetical protein